jgi:hypothetical protein
LPADNQKDWTEVPAEVRDRMKVHFVQRISEVLRWPFAARKTANPGHDASGPRYGLGLRSPSWFLTTLLLGAAALLRARTCPRPTAPRARRELKPLAEELRESVPSGEAHGDVQGMIRIRDGDGRRRSLPFHYRVFDGRRLAKCL